MIKLSKYWPVFWFGADAIAIRPWIFIRNDIKDANIINAISAHEAVHLRQQKEIKFWFIKYILTTEFRLAQELEAYRAQYEYCRMHKNQGWDLFALKNMIAGLLSSNMYLKMISRADADKIVSRW